MAKKMAIAAASKSARNTSSTGATQGSSCESAQITNEPEVGLPGRGPGEQFFHQGLIGQHEHRLLDRRLRQAQLIHRA